MSVCSFTTIIEVLAGSRKLPRRVDPVYLLTVTAPEFAKRYTWVAFPKELAVVLASLKAPTGLIVEAILVCCSNCHPCDGGV